MAARSPSLVTEVSLVTRLQLGESAAQVEFYARYRDVVFRTVRQQVRSIQDAEEVTNTALFKALRGIASFQGTARLSTWLHRIAFNAAMSHLRARRRQMALDREGSARTDGGLPETPDSPHRSPERLLAGQQAWSQVQQEVGRFTGRRRTIASRILLEERPARDVAEEMGISLGSVKSELHRARRLVQRRLVDVYDERGRGMSR